ncbi:glycosyltransferase family 4 protein [Azospirillum sp.]|uniref:glycosyltransferase family 4 protein n=1 Tax=Azospirillum sp. TaxID=34012 RepID=UPI002D5BBA54|nr:glycosyltransferase family 4 protein [Azospirillum sp.]HYD64565.1 glycosyltransferase family 4 protein [Azospirillum sp.]
MLPTARLTPLDVAERRRALATARLGDVGKTIWLIRPDLRALFEDDPAGFEWWLLMNGSGEYHALAEADLAVALDVLSEPADEALPGVEPGLTRLMTRVWAMRPDLQAAFDLATREGRQGFVWWYFVYGAAELGLGRFFTEEQKSFLNEPDPEVPDDAFVPVTRLMRQVWVRRPSLQAACPLGEPGGRGAFLDWYFTRGLGETRLADVVDDRQARALLAPLATPPRVPRILAMIWAADPAVQERFPDPGHPGFRDWARGEGRESYPVLRRLAEMGALAPPAPMVGAGGGVPSGVNLIGYARGQFGLGEDVRMAALALKARNIPFAIRNIQPGRDVCQGERGLEALITDSLPYAVNLICTTGIETARVAATEGTRLLDGRRTIGYWPWELPEWPVEWRHAYNLVDEVWASSRHTYDAYAKSCPKPVRHVPMAVTVDATAGLGRRDFALRKDRFLFVFSFDLLSGLARKNPQACLRAFRTAFPRGDEPAGLVVKAMRATPDDPLWQGLLAEAATDNRIAVISGTLSRAAVLDLYRACDCFVSLHRAEGFGRGIVEAMMLGKPVVVTGYSGNMDFTTPGTAALVDHRLRRVAPGEYPFAQGQLWAEPDVEHAAWWMRRLVEDRHLRERLARQGRRLTAATYAPAVVGAGYAALLGPTV